MSTTFAWFYLHSPPGLDFRLTTLKAPVTSRWVHINDNALVSIHQQLVSFAKYRAIIIHYSLAQNTLHGENEEVAGKGIALSETLQDIKMIWRDFFLP